MVLLQKTFLWFIEYFLDTENSAQIFYPYLETFTNSVSSALLR